MANWHRLCRLVLMQLDPDGKRRVRNRGYSGLYTGVYARGIIMEKLCISIRKYVPTRYLKRWNLRALEWRHLFAIRRFLRIWMAKCYADLEAILVITDAEGSPHDDGVARHGLRVEGRHDPLHDDARTLALASGRLKWWKIAVTRRQMK